MTTPDPKLIRTVVAERRPSMTMALLLALTANNRFEPKGQCTMSTALAEISARYEGHPFVDYFDCLTAALSAARERNKKAVRAALAGDAEAVARHTHMRRHYMGRVRQWHAMIDWSAVNG